MTSHPGPEQLALFAGNENAAQQTLDNIRKFQIDYAAKHQGRFATFAEFIQSGHLDERFAGETPVSFLKSREK